MIEVIGFWVTVTLTFGLPFWFFGYRITRWILSIAKSSAPEIPYGLRKGNHYSWGKWDYTLYPQWAHKLNGLFGGNFLDTGGTAILGVLSFVPTVILMIGIFQPQQTVIGLVSELGQFAAVVVGWASLVIISSAALYISVSRGARLIGLVQIQEMKDKMK